MLIHTADPHQFWLPHDKYNERWQELVERPRRKRPPEPTWETLMQEQWSVFQKHPDTQFISAHLSWLGHDLGRLGKLLDELPNMHVGLGAVIYEFGRQPRFARQFLLEHGERVLMGKDSYNRDEFNTYFRVLETADEYFDYYRDYHAFWADVRTRLAELRVAAGLLRECGETHSGSERGGHSLGGLPLGIKRWVVSVVHAPASPSRPPRNGE